MVEVIRFPGTVEWTGENPGISLKTDPNGPFTTLGELTYRKLDSVESSGDPSNIYSETVKAGDLTVSLTWSGLGVPFCFVNPPELSATGKHHMPSVFVGCLDASILVNGKRMPGAPIPREVAGRKITTAMLAFSESWIRAE